MKYTFFLLALLLISPHLNAPAFANSSARPDLATSSAKFPIPEGYVRPYKDLSEVPEEALIDAAAFHGECLGDIPLSGHYNCECLATFFLDERIRTGPLASRSAIVPKILKYCHDDAAAAGTAYNKCIQYGSMGYPGGEMSPEEYCECLANNYAIIFKNAKLSSLRPKTLNGIYKTSILRCQGTYSPPGSPYRRQDQ